MVSFALPQDPTPTAIEELLDKLPAKAQAEIRWFPQTLRAEFIEPLRAAKDARTWRRTLDGLLVPALRVFLRLTTTAGPIFDDPAVAKVLGSITEEQDVERHRLIAQKLEPIDDVAADELREVFELMRQIVAAAFLVLKPHLSKLTGLGETLGAGSDEDLARELSGPNGAFLRGLMLTVAALESVLDKRPPPPRIVDWCDLAFNEMHATARALRAAGVPVASTISIPGFTAKEWRERRATRAFSGLDAREIRRFDAALGRSPTKGRVRS
jgi:hypothetical protein